LNAIDFRPASCYLQVIALLDVTMNAAPATNLTLFDFQGATRSTAWKRVNDDVIGGVSTSQFELSREGFAVFSGTIRLDHHGGFASAHSKSPLHGNFGGLTGFIVRVRGDGRQYRFTVRAGLTFDLPLYQCQFATTPGIWEEVRLPLENFVAAFRGRVLADVPPLNPAELGSVGFLTSDREAGPFHLEIAWIKALIGSPLNRS
jgi:NADH dehydrogenase [ubiquinone] 1 alpha subcomplex assembly factor 1